MKNTINVSEILDALKYIANDTRHVKSFKFNDFIHLYQQPMISEKTGKYINSYAKYCYRHQFYLSCYGINVHLFNMWDDEINITDTHANMVTSNIEHITERVKSIIL